MLHADGDLSFRWPLPSKSHHDKHPQAPRKVSISTSLLLNSDTGHPLNQVPWASHLLRLDQSSQDTPFLESKFSDTSLRIPPAAFYLPSFCWNSVEMGMARLHSSWAAGLKNHQFTCVQLLFIKTSFPKLSLYAFDRSLSSLWTAVWCTQNYINSVITRHLSLCHVLWHYIYFYYWYLPIMSKQRKVDFMFYF